MFLIPSNLVESSILTLYHIGAFLNSLIDSIASPKVKTTEGEGVGVHSLIHSISGVEGRVGAPGWGAKMNDK
jgi:hypothetical protein